MIETDIYQNIYSGFTHLDNYLGLFTQMQRRLYKEPMEITGRKINNHIEAVFKEKFEEYKKLLIHENPNVFQITKDGLIKIIAGNEEDIENFCLLHHIDFQK